MSKRIGKNVAGVQYIHRSLLDELDDFSYDAYFLYAKDIVENVLGTTGYPIMFDWTIMSIDRNKNTVSFIECPRWDIDFEPAVGTCITVKLDDLVSEMSTVKLTKPTKNPRIFHSRHLFVSDDYTAFSLLDDKQRVADWEKLNPNKRRMGRLNWWFKFCQKHGLEA